VTNIVDEKRRRRLAVMYELYKLTGGRYLAEVDRGLIAQNLGWKSAEIDEVVEYLEREGLLEVPTYSGGVCITHDGVREVEQALTAPDRKTEHFAPAATVLVHGDVIGSQIQSGTVGSSQQQSGVAIGDQRAPIDAFVEAFRRAIEGGQMPDADRRIASAALAAVEPQLALDEPNEVLVGEGLRTLRSVAENLAANGIFMGLVELAHHVHL
jgi:hypothetical protein